AINYVGDDSFILKVDDLTYQKAYDHALYYRVYLDGELIADNVTEMTYLLDGLITEPTHIAEVEAVYETGESEKTEVIISQMGNSDENTDEYAIYPNPSKGKVWIKLEERANVNLYDLQGRKLYSGKKEAGASLMRHDFPAGTYLIPVETAKG